MDNNHGRTKIIIQARNNATRLKNKMSLPFFEGKGILEILLARLSNNFLPENIILATTFSKSDDILVAIAERIGVGVFRGSEEDVLDRFIKASEFFHCNKIIRVCADNPFLDIQALKTLYEELNKSSFDYIAFELKSGLPTIKSHIGFYAEGVKLSSLMKIKDSTHDKLFMEHVTNYIYAHPAKFSIKWLQVSSEVQNRIDLRFTVDTIDDFNTASLIFNQISELNSDWNISNLISFIDQHTEYKKSMLEQITLNSK